MALGRPYSVAISMRIYPCNIPHSAHYYTHKSYKLPSNQPDITPPISYAVHQIMDSTMVPNGKEANNSYDGNMSITH